MPQIPGGNWTCKDCKTEWATIITYEGEMPQGELRDFVGVTCDTTGCKGSTMQYYPKGMKIVSIKLVAQSGK